MYKQDDMDDVMSQVLLGGSHKAPAQEDFLSQAVHAKINFSELNNELPQDVLTTGASSQTIKEVLNSQGGEDTSEPVVKIPEYSP